MDATTTIRDIHIFCDASEHASGAVALKIRRWWSNRAEFHITLFTGFPKTTALCTEATVTYYALNLPIRQTILWTDSTTVLHWLQADSCHNKVFVGARVSEIQTLTNSQDWKYVDSANNPADDLTRDKSLPDLLNPNRWSNVTQFLHGPSSTWPKFQPAPPDDDQTEFRKSYFCGIINAI